MIEERVYASDRFRLACRGHSAGRVRLTELLPLESQSGLETYGIVSNLNPTDGTFAYMAAVKIREDFETPVCLMRIEIPAKSYLVFHISMLGGAVHPQVKDAMRHTWGKLILDSDLSVSSFPDLERCDGVLAPDQAGAKIEYFVPVDV